MHSRELVGVFPRALTLTKCCPSCRVFKWPYQFGYRSGRRHAELRGQCKECSVRYNQRVRAADPEAVREKERAYVHRNREHISKQRRLWRQANPERVREIAKRSHPAARRKWREKNGPGVARERERARLRTRLHRDARRDPDTLIWTRIISADPCCYCGGLSEHWDHVIPISAGGDSLWTNLTGACAACNPSKHATPLLFFLLRRVGAEAPR